MRPFQLFLSLCLALSVGAEEVAFTETRLPSESPGKIHQTVKPTYPIRMLHQGVTRGEAQVLLEIDRRGVLTDILPIAFTHRSFAEAAIEAARQWRYDPPRIGGEKVGLVANVNFIFSVNGVIAVEKHGAETTPDTNAFDRGFVYRPHGLSKLDHMPKPIDLPPPIYTDEWAQEGRLGDITVTFYIDETGRARIPVVQHEADEWLTSASLAAVRQWRFAPCTFKGKPVLVCAQQTFTFDPRRPATAAVSRK